MKKLLFLVTLTMGLFLAGNANACRDWDDGYHCGCFVRSMGTPVSPATGFFGPRYYGYYGDSCYVVRGHHNRHGVWIPRHLVCGYYYY